MERIGEVQLTSVLAPTSELSRRRLPDADSIHLAALLSQMADRYPSQDLADSMEAYLWDYERLALQYSIAEVQAFLTDWRITGGRSFFPRPDECDTWIASEREKCAGRRARRAQEQRRLQEIAEFWAWAPQWMEDTGNDEAELLRRFPSYRGTKP